ncbi:MAG TPA: GNAT family N-acetyltransferase, partial [Thermomicrobiales bacterium]|nr:GNAT family N-acetyltransferase [Thermomicrobiales bacterium]
MTLVDADRVRIRPATAADLVAAAQVYRLADGAPASEETAALEDLRVFHEDDPAQVWVAEADGAIVGMGAALIRGRHWHLVYLFVLPVAQGRGLGRALLHALHAAGRDAGCTLLTTESSADPRALSRYFGLGLRPAVPALAMIAGEPSFPSLRWDDGLERRPLTLDADEAIATATDIDKAIRGAPRERDLRRWLAAGAAGDLLLRCEPLTPAGYFLIEAGGEEGRIGPVAAIDAERLPDVLGRALAAAGDVHRPGMPWRAELPGECWA